MLQLNKTGQSVVCWLLTQHRLFEFIKSLVQIHLRTIQTLEHAKVTQLETWANMMRKGWNSSSCLSLVVPFGTEDTCREMWESQMLNDSCPCVWLYSPQRDTDKLLLWESGGRYTFSLFLFLLCTVVVFLLNLIFLVYVFRYCGFRVIYPQCIAPGSYFNMLVPLSVNTF